MRGTLTHPPSPEKGLKSGGVGVKPLAPLFRAVLGGGVADGTPTAPEGEIKGEARAVDGSPHPPPALKEGATRLVTPLPPLYAGRGKLRQAGLPRPGVPALPALGPCLSGLWPPGAFGKPLASGEASRLSLGAGGETLRYPHGGGGAV